MSHSKQHFRNQSSSSEHGSSRLLYLTADHHLKSLPRLRAFKDYSETRFCLKSVGFNFFSLWITKCFPHSNTGFQKWVWFLITHEKQITDPHESTDHKLKTPLWLKTSSRVETNRTMLIADRKLTLSCSSIELRITWAASLAIWSCVSVTEAPWSTMTTICLDWGRTVET